MESLQLELQKALKARNFSNFEEMNAFIGQFINEHNERIDRGEQPLPATDPADRARELVIQARQAAKKSDALRLAREALGIDPHCTDALLIFAEHEVSPRRRLEVLDEAWVIAHAKLGKGFLKKNVGHFWGLIETRPFMRISLARCLALEQLNMIGAAIDAYFDMLKLNPGDNQGVRYLCCTALMRAGLWEDARDILKDYKDDVSADFQYNRALVDFMLKANEKAFESAMQKAMEANQYIFDSLIDPDFDPDTIAGPDSYTPGSEEEAIFYLKRNFDLWRYNPAAAFALARFATGLGGDSGEGDRKRKGKNIRRVK